MTINQTFFFLSVLSFTFSSECLDEEEIISNGKGTTRKKREEKAERHPKTKVLFKYLKKTLLGSIEKIHKQR